MKKKLLLLTTLSALFVLTTTCFFLLLPYLCDLYLLPRLIKELPFSEKELSLSRISPWKTRATITLADKDRHAVSISRLELHYTPTSLLKGRINTLLVDSASLHLELQNGHVVIPGLSVDSLKTSTSPKKNPPALLLPLSIETLIVKNSTITLHKSQKETINIILDGRFNLDFSEQDANKKLLTALSGDILLRGDLALSTKLELKTVANGHELNLQLQAPNLGQAADFLPAIDGLELGGQLNLNSLVEIEQLSKVTSYTTKVELSRFHASISGFTIENRSPEEPITLDFEGNPDKLHYALTNIVLVAPEKSSLAMKGAIEIPQQRFTGTGNIVLERIQPPITINFNGNHNQSGTQINYGLKSDTFTLGESLYLSPVTAEGAFKIEGSSVSGHLNGQFSKIIDNNSGTTLAGISLQIPFQYPFSANDKIANGNFAIGEIHYQDVNSGSLRATLTPSQDGLAFSSLFTSPFGPDLKITCDGSLQLTSDFTIKCRLPKTEIESSSLPPYIDLPNEIIFSGGLEAEGEFNSKDNTPTGKLSIAWHDGTLNFNENILSDINFQMDFPHLPLIQSAPGQLCTIGSLEFGKIKLSDARIRFRIENEESIFLEKSRLSWCGGKVETGSFRLSKEMEELETTLYCDRLSFIELLDQFGIENTEGEGSLNGRLPLFISSNRIHFDDGFLFSTPGNSGIVRFNNTEQLRQGLPNIDQAAYLDYSMKAMENFAYNWTKLSFNSQDEDLLITLQLDGKPSEPLPFGYKNGHIVPSNKGPGLQHPIRLDVNFRLPLQNMFQYGKNIQSLMENM